MRILLFAAYILSFGAGLYSQEKPRPQFMDYPVQHIYRGKPAPLILNADQRTFRTMVLRGAKSPVEFAGHYTVPTWGCGAGCSQFAIVDSINGKVFDAPFYLSELPDKWEKMQNDHVPERLEFHPGSRLLKINACPTEKDCGFYDYEMVESKGLVLRRKELLPAEFQYYFQGPLELFLFDGMS